MCRAKGFQHQRMSNGAMNVEIGNPAYKIYEGEPDDDAGELLDADFTLDPDKVENNTSTYTHTGATHTIYLSNAVIWTFHSPPTSQIQYMPLCTWELTTAATLWPAQTRRRSCSHVGMRSRLWTHWHRLSIGSGHTIPNTPLFLPFNKKKRKKKKLRENRQKV